MLAAALSFGVVACNGQKQSAPDEAAKQNAEAAEEKAHAMEDAGSTIDEQADAMIKKAEDKADGNAAADSDDATR